MWNSYLSQMVSHQQEEGHQDLDQDHNQNQDLQWLEDPMCAGCPQQEHRQDWMLGGNSSNAFSTLDLPSQAHSTGDRSHLPSHVARVPIL